MSFILCVKAWPVPPTTFNQINRLKPRKKIIFCTFGFTFVDSKTTFCEVRHHLTVQFISMSTPATHRETLNITIRHYNITINVPVCPCFVCQPITAKASGEKKNKTNKTYRDASVWAVKLWITSQDLCKLDNRWSYNTSNISTWQLWQIKNSVKAGRQEKRINLVLSPVNVQVVSKAPGDCQRSVHKVLSEDTKKNAQHRADFWPVPDLSEQILPDSS